MDPKKSTKRIVGRPFEKGNKGKPKGTLNKVPAAIATTVKETVLRAFQILQEDPNNNLVSFAKRYPRDFYAIAAKLIPSEVNATVTRSQDIKFVFVEDTTCEPLLADSSQVPLLPGNNHQGQQDGHQGQQDGHQGQGTPIVGIIQTNNDEQGQGQQGQGQQDPHQGQGQQGQGQDHGHQGQGQQDPHQDQDHGHQGQD